MNDSVERVVKEAKAWEGRYFSTVGYGAPGPYCAAFVRYVFRIALGEAGEMPVVMADRYRAMGHPYTGYPVCELFADSLAGDPIGPAIAANLMRPGDLLFFIDTYSGYAQGTITHIGIYGGGGGLMADAGSGSLVHVRNHALYFPDKLVEVRRPKCLGTVAKRTFITLEHGQARAMLHGAKAFQRHAALECQRQGNQTRVHHRRNRHRRPAWLRQTLLPPQPNHRAEGWQSSPEAGGQGQP